MFNESEETEIIKEVNRNVEVQVYREITHSQVKHRSWFHRAVINPILKPLLAKLFSEYTDLIVRVAIKEVIKAMQK